MTRILSLAAAAGLLIAAIAVAAIESHGAGLQPNKLAASVLAH